MRYLVFISIMVFLSGPQFNLVAQPVEGSTVIYKQLDTLQLSLKVYQQARVSGKSRPAIVFFFGGGWNSRNLTQFEPHALFFAQRGMVAFIADYRVKNQNQSSPFDAAADALSAVRYIRDNATVLGVDPSRIVAAGGSAGGHLAAVTGNIKGLDDPLEDLSVSSAANALILFNPVFDNGPAGYGFERVGGEARYKSISPIDNIRRGAPPTCVFLGTNDHLIPVETAQRYKKRMEEVGSRCDLHLFPGEKHGFFNYKKNDEANTNYYSTLKLADDFLVSIGYLK